MHHTNSRIYRRALELTALVHEVTEQLPRGYGFLGDQLRRAAASVALNFAEGCGKRSRPDRQRYFLTAKGSAYEVAAGLDVAGAFRSISPELHARGLDLCDHLGAMLSRYR
jgi:four helix bundle protein